MNEMISIKTLDGALAFSAYCARPATPPKAAIIVIQEIFGVNPGIRQKADDWAARGYLAIAPDMFWRLKPNLEFDPDVPEQFQAALGYMMKFSADDGVKDIEACIHFARAETDGGRIGPLKVGCVGYCLGGRLAYMAATRTDINASVGYYGVMIDQMLGESHAIAHPLMLHIPTADGFVTPDKQAAMHAGLNTHPKVTLHDYAGLDHGFADTFGKRRDEAGAKLADERTAAFFGEWLG
jgi:carboxymethylenebutenolidase